MGRQPAEIIDHADDPDHRGAGEQGCDLAHLCDRCRKVAERSNPVRGPGADPAGTVPEQTRGPVQNRGQRPCGGKQASGVHGHSASVGSDLAVGFVRGAAGIVDQAHMKSQAACEGNRHQGGEHRRRGDSGEVPGRVHLPGKPRKGSRNAGESARNPGSISPVPGNPSKRPEMVLQPISPPLEKLLQTPATPFHLIDIEKPSGYLQLSAKYRKIRKVDHICEFLQTPEKQRFTPRFRR